MAAIAAVLFTTACGNTGTPPAVSGSPSAVAASASPSASPSTAVAIPPPSVGTDGTVTIEVSKWPPGIVLAGDDAIWVTVPKVTSIDIVRIDPTTNEPTTVLADLPAAQIAAVGVAGSVWVVNWDTSSVTEYDPATGRELATLPVGDSPIEPVVAFGDLWTLDHHGGTVTRIDPETSTVVATVEVAAPGLAGPLSHAIAGGLLWVAAPNTPHIVAIDPETNLARHTLELEPECQPSISGAANRVWLWSCQYRGGNVIDPETLEPVGVFPADTPAVLLTSPLVVDDRNWVPVQNAATNAESLAAVDLESFELVDEFPLASEHGSAVAAFDSMWLSGGGSAVVRVPATTLRE